MELGSEFGQGAVRATGRSGIARPRKSSEPAGGTAWRRAPALACPVNAQACRVGV